jgi:hypothetical protein
VGGLGCSGQPSAATKNRKADITAQDRTLQHVTKHCSDSDNDPLTFFSAAIAFPTGRFQIIPITVLPTRWAYRNPVKTIIAFR